MRLNLCLFFSFIIITCLFLVNSNIENFKNEGVDLNDLADDVGFDNLFSTNSKYQSIDVIRFNPNEQGHDKCLILNDEMQLCNNDEEIYHEMITHFPASYLKTLRHVLIIGGGDLMTLREIMKYETIESVKMLELDEMVINTSKKFFNTNDFKYDPRVSIVIGDASKNINSCFNNYYDLVILDTTEDSENNTPLDKEPFFKLCKSKMNQRGILVKNGFIVDDMEDEMRIHKIKIIDQLQNTFDKVDIYNAQIGTYSELNIYSFIMCSDVYGIMDKQINNETIRISKGLKEYNISKHQKYIN